MGVRYVLYVIVYSAFILALYALIRLISVLITNHKINKAVRFFSSPLGQKAELESEIDREIFNRECDRLENHW